MADDVRWYLLFLRRYELKIAEAFRVFREAGIEPILIKGWAASRFYPEGSARYFTDIDLAVAAEDFERADEIRRNELSSLEIDLHKDLRHLDTLTWSELFERSELVPLEGSTVRVLCPEDHLRVLCVHWLSDGGEYRERLWDIYHAVNNRPARFDWNKCLGVVSQTRRRWIIAMIGLANRYLDLDISELPFAEEAQSLPGWLTRAVEKAWASNVRLRPLQTCLRDPKLLLQQIRKRIPPNPIQATVDLEGEFDERSRIGYQMRDIVFRLTPSLRRFVPLVIGR